MKNGSHDFEQFMKQREEASRAFVNGDAGPLGRIVTHVSPATFFGPMGGYEQGAEEVASTHERGAAQFESGDTNFEILQMTASGLAYCVDLQRANARSRLASCVEMRSSLYQRVLRAFGYRTQRPSSTLSKNRSRTRHHDSPVVPEQSRRLRKVEALFDSHAKAHRAAGLALEHLWSSADDSNEVFFLFAVANTQKVRAFIDAPEAANTAKASGVLNGEYHFVRSRKGY